MSIQAVAVQRSAFVAIRCSAELRRALCRFDPGTSIRRCTGRTTTCREFAEQYAGMKIQAVAVKSSRAFNREKSSAESRRAWTRCPASILLGSFCMRSTHETLGSGTAPPCSPGTCGPRSSRTRRTSRPWRTPSNSSCLSRNGKAIRGNENPGHGCEKQGVQSRKVLCRIT